MTRYFCARGYILLNSFFVLIFMCKKQFNRFSVHISLTIYWERKTVQMSLLTILSATSQELKTLNHEPVHYLFLANKNCFFFSENLTDIKIKNCARKKIGLKCEKKYVNSQATGVLKSLEC